MGEPDFQERWSAQSILLRSLASTHRNEKSCLKDISTLWPTTQLDRRPCSENGGEIRSPKQRSYRGRSCPDDESQEWCKGGLRDSEPAH